MRTLASVPVCLIGVCWCAALSFLAAADDSPTGLRPAGVTVKSQDSCGVPERLIDGDAKTECTFERTATPGDIDASVTLDLGRPCVVEALLITNSASDPVRWVTEIEVGPDARHFRALLGRSVNLPMFSSSEAATISVMPSAARYVRVSFGGVRKGAIAEIGVRARPNVPERHMLCWAGDIKRDYLDKLDYIDKDLGITDLWLDHVDSAFPQTVTNGGFSAWTQSGLFERLKERGIRYWLCEHEAFSFMVKGPEDLRDDLAWQTTFRRVRRVYAKVRDLGFRGLLCDAEDYTQPNQAAREKYADVADYVSSWSFNDEFGLGGMYYHRGKQFGKTLRDVWPQAIYMQLYEARMYDGIPGCRDGNYWWLKGIHDEGVEIWIATEKTYGAGAGEIAGEGAPKHLTQWFVRLPRFLADAHREFPFATRILPGFHPWNCRTKAPNYLPKYLSEQVGQVPSLARGWWLYCEGNPHAGDPRETLDPALCAKYGVTAQEYVDVLKPARSGGALQRPE